MATLRLITESEFRASRYGQVADQVEGSLSDLIAQAEDHLEHVVDRSFASTSHVEILRPKGDLLFVRHRPIISLTTVKRRFDATYAWYSLDTGDFYIEGSGNEGVIRSLLGEVVDYEVEVTYVSGYAAIPWDVKAAVILQTVIFAYQDLEVYGSGDARTPGIVYLQDQVDRYMRPHRKVMVK